MRWVFMVATGLLLLLYIANLPFYSGAHVGDDYSWRMEHGRLSINRNAQRSPRSDSPRSARESFYIALNSEGLRWSWEWRSYSEAHWKIAIPLW
ncbi:MAG: hypothetical protein ACYTGZ_22365, partial [Planctomycetota bacterium]